MEYLLILCVIFLAALFIETHFRVHLYHSLKERIVVTLNIFVFGMAWDYFAVYRRHWIFPGDGLIGIRLWGLPIEEFLFFLIVPYFALVLYKFYDKKIK
ncbi:MAG: lycopene cyclase domain-containing protein [bacterium]|nr:lycopene cyclase domain-containing protein [bacterium]